MIEAVTVLLPVFNGMPYLPDAVASILGQDFEEFELLIIDDGSTDASREYLAEISDSRVRVVSRENRGLVATLNQGLALATHNRRILDVGGYRKLLPAEDLDLWLRVVPFTKLAVLDEPLMLQRIVRGGLSSSAYLWQHTMWDYVRACAEARERGVPEPEPEVWTSEHAPRGLRRLVAEASPRLRRAGLAWTEGRLLQAAGHGGLAFLCNPALVTRKLRGYFSRTAGSA